METRVLGVRLELDSSPDLAGLRLGLESFISGLGLGLGLETYGLGLDSDSDRRDSPDSANCTDKNRFQAT